ncbi:MAG TPA: hypothetical protein VF950_28470 [Planctomycetota bacterium]
MRIRTRILLLAAFAALLLSLIRACRANESGKAWARFMEFDGAALSSLSDARRVEAEALFERFAPLDPKGPVTDARPWAMLRLDPQGRRERVVALRSFRGPADVGVILPGAHATVLDAEGTILSAVPLVFGVEEPPTAVEKLHRADAGGWCVEVIVPAEEESLRMSYAILGDRPALVRVSGEDGEARRRPPLSLGAGGLGPALPKRSPVEWTYPLRSENPAEVLEALSWLGVRFDEDEEEPGPYDHLKRVRADSGLRSWLAKLSTSPNAWIAANARLAALSK